MALVELALQTVLLVGVRVVAGGALAARVLHVRLVPVQVLGIELGAGEDGRADVGDLEWLAVESRWGMEAVLRRSAGVLTSESQREREKSSRTTTRMSFSFSLCGAMV